MKSKNLSALNIRTYQTGDEEQLVKLWDSAHTNYGGYVPKTPEYWRWCVVQRPGVEAEDILILEQEKHILAYAVLAQRTETRGYTGTILEFAIGPWLPAAERKLVASELIAEVEKRSRLRGDELLNLMVPCEDEVVVKVLGKAGYKAEALEVFQLVIVDLVLLLRRILDKRKVILSSTQFSSFRIALQPGYYRYCPYESVRIELRPEPLVEESTFDADYTVFTDLSTITDIIFRRDSFNHALSTNKIKIKPENGVEPVRTLFQLLTLNSEWYLPTVDGR